MQDNKKSTKNSCEKLNKKKFNQKPKFGFMKQRMHT